MIQFLFRYNFCKSPILYAVKNIVILYKLTVKHNKKFCYKHLYSFKYFAPYEECSGKYTLVNTQFSGVICEHNVLCYGL